MASDFMQVELTDQELEHVMGGSSSWSSWSGGGAAVGTVAGVGADGSSAGVQAVGVGSGAISIGSGLGVAHAFQVDGPAGTSIQFSNATGVAVGGGIG